MIVIMREFLTTWMKICNNFHLNLILLHWILLSFSYLKRSGNHHVWQMASNRKGSWGKITFFWPFHIGHFLLLKHSERWCQFKRLSDRLLKIWRITSIENRIRLRHTFLVSICNIYDDCCVHFICCVNIEGVNAVL